MIKAIIFDIYGTLLKQGDLENSLAKKEMLLKAFSKIKKKYKLKSTPNELLDLFVSSIDRIHRIKKARGIKSPEVKIEKIWAMILKKIDYRFDKNFLFKIAYEHNCMTGKRALYPNVILTLKKLKEKGLKLGIVSNAQFYTEMDMNSLLSKDLDIKSLYDLFDKNLVFMSYKLGYSKPNPKAFIILKEKLKKIGIKPNETLYIGNDMIKDVLTAKKQSFKTCLFVNIETKYAIAVKPDYKIKDIRLIIDIVNKKRLQELYKASKNKKFYSISEFKKIIIPLLDRIISKHKNKTTIIGIQGGIGTGKTTLVNFLKEILKQMGYNIQSFSIDDFYKTRKERLKLSRKFKQNPFYQISRGLPGTHRINVLWDTLQRIKKGKNFNIPIFDKSLYNAYGDVLNKKIKIKKKPDFILFEGWCIGIPYISVHELSAILNKYKIKNLDYKPKHAKIVLKYVKSYQKLWKYLDCIIMLMPKNIELHKKWRYQQELKLRKVTGKGMSRKEINRFVRPYIPFIYLCYEKIKPDIKIELDERHRFIKLK
ncbi:MAG: HAD hydrolase-like protein [Nanoarchaeota archaeon]|nr:HAD hydrolase-like protein [Nanoarchaeota archaeon]